MTYFNGAESRFKTFSTSGYNIPKPKFLFYINFVTSYFDYSLKENLGFLVKNMDRIVMQPRVTKMNQYNKKRVVQTGIDYGPLSFSLHDTVDGTVMKLIDSYMRFYYGDFEQKRNQNWIYDITSGFFSNNEQWGLKANQRPLFSYYFDRIEIYEIYDQVYSQTNFINPKFSSIEQDNLDYSVSEGTQVTFTCEYEGIVAEKIAEPVTQELANRFGLPFSNTKGLFSGLFNIPGTNNILGTIANSALNNIFNNIKSRTGLGPAIDMATNIIPQVGLNAALTNANILGSRISGSLANRVIPGDIYATSSLLDSVQQRVNAGQTVRDITSLKIKQQNNINIVI